jgi:hypothetical protein
LTRTQRSTGGGIEGVWRNAAGYERQEIPNRNTTIVEKQDYSLDNGNAILYDSPMERLILTFAWVCGLRRPEFLAEYPALSTQAMCGLGLSVMPVSFSFRPLETRP